MCVKGGDRFSKRIFSNLDITETGVLILYISSDVLSTHNFQKWWLIKHLVGSVSD